MKKYIFTLFLTLFAASSVWAQNYDFEKDDINYHYDSEWNTLSVTSNTNGYYSGDIVIPQFVSGETNIFSESIQRSIVLGVNSVGSFFTSNYGVQRITELGDNATNVIFALEIFDDEFRIISGTEAENEIVKSQSSETKFVMIGDATAEKFIKADWSRAKNYIDIDGKLENGKAAVAFKNDKLAGFFEVMNCDYENNELQLHIWTGKIEKVSFTATVTSIEGYAFYDCANLTSVIIPSTVTEVGEGAFYGCTKLKDVTCLATTPPEANANSFENYNGYLHVPCESKDDYDFANCWGSFKHVECIGSETVELQKDEV
ncbi:MAG: leucine-rich repeat protein, partial [Bacteroidales bacterium]|nr:leucine-rich repeat protein [Bacteroidales bacterium]